MYNPFSLKGKTILVTGASSGIGRAIAIECSKFGATLLITARNEERLNETLSQMKGTNHSIVIADLVKEYERGYGPLTPKITNSPNKWNWCDGPWPWEREYNEEI